MAQTHDGAMKVLAKRAGVSLEIFQQNLSNGLKWCYSCKEFHPVEEFNKDASRYDGLDPKCSKSRSARRKERYVPIPPELQKKRGPIGGKLSLEARKKISDASARRKAAGIPGPRLGKKHSVETKIKISAIVREKALRGKDCHSYKDGKHAERMGERYSAEYKQWRFDVYARDKFTCQLCGDARGGNLHAHHILPFADFPKLRLYVPNGLTLCEDCHKEILYGKQQ